MKKVKSFAPMLAPNEQPDLDTLNYGLLASTKLDGCRLLSYKGELVTRSLKPLQNKQLREKFEPLRARTENSNLTLADGEIYAEGIPFYMITSCFKTLDYTAKKSIKAWDKLCEEYDMDITREEVLEKLKFYMFDCVYGDEFEDTFDYRNIHLHDLAREFEGLVVPVHQQMVHSADEVRTMFKEVLDRGYEGLILKDPHGRYKFGRGTLNEALIFKVKPYVTLDAQIIGVKQATKVDPNAPKTINELGRSVTSKKKEDRILIPRAKTFTVIYEQECSKCNNGLTYTGIDECPHMKCDKCNESGTTKHEVDVNIGRTEKERDEIYANKESYLGRWIEYKGLLVGAKDVPRSCNMVRWREDKDE